MGGNSVSEDEDGVRFPPEAVKPFWVEVGVFTLAGLASVVVWVVLLRLWVVDPVPIVLMPILLTPIIPAVVLPPVFRAILRPVLRRRAQLGPDPLPWWFKVYGVVWAADHARDVSPAWHIEEDRLHLPVLGHGAGVFVGGLIIAIVLALIEPQAGAWLYFLAPPLTIITAPFALLMLLSAVANIYRMGRLRARGAASSFPFVGWHYD
ncbi:hypothetical protein [Maricaulis maris]|uniref:Uncharacterized protein n=1 Tax=Maricaulis maris TaxID=74318 RepID=A0A495D180_9PROT|nr:hypothetical protein [Maricaulis maris]RKQ95246.1 hypothetical protein C7435_2935 [Maricaulis maris]